MDVDTHKKAIADHTESPYSDIEAELINATGATLYDEALKITHSLDITVSNKTLIGGTEDCLDCVRTGKLSVSNCIMNASKHTRVFITDKGGGTEHIYTDIILDGKTRWPWDLSFGDWTNYNSQKDWPPLDTVILDNVRRTNGKRVVVLQLYCNKIVKKNGTKAFIINLRLIAPLWFWIKRRISKKTNLDIPTYL